jgi:hypothetical protein
MIPDNIQIWSGYKVIFVLQSNESILSEMNRYLADVIGPVDDNSFFVSPDGYAVAAKLWATARSAEKPYVETYVTLNCDVGAPFAIPDKKAFLRSKFKDRQYKDCRVSLYSIDRLPL